MSDKSASPAQISDEQSAPLDCIECLRSIGPMYPLGADCAGWICPDCYKKLEEKE